MLIKKIRLPKGINKVPDENYKPSVKIVAIAKDEGAYFSEWVHHHLYLGFDAIDIYLNRTTDNSVDILDKIAEQHSQVTYYSADWIDTCHPQASRYLQYIIYAKAFAENKETKEFDYILFIDVDEFWFPSSPELKVQEVIKHLAFPECIVFQWVNEDGSEPSFSSLGQSFTGQLHSNVKSMVHREAPISVIQLHYPEMKNDSCGIFVDKTAFASINQADFKQLMKPALSKIRDVMIVHRCNRSEMEYISLLHRGRPSDEIPLKLNRGGYNVNQNREVTLDWPLDQFKAFERARINFFDQLQLSDALVKARSFVSQRAEKCIASISTTSRLYPKEVKTIFKNITHEEVIKALAAASESTVFTPQQTNENRGQFKKSYIRLFRAWISGDVDYLRDFAIQLESSHLKVAFYLMKRAAKFRPNGPLIKKKMADYKRRLLN
jgi:hypothetical protein